MDKRLKDQLSEFGITSDMISTNPRMKNLLDDVEAQYNTLRGYVKDDMFHAVLNAIPGYVSWISSDLKYLGVNDELAKAFNLSTWDFIGRPIDFLEAAGPFLTFASSLIFSEREHDSWICTMNFGDSSEGQEEENLSWYLLQGQKYNAGQNAVIVGIEITDVKKAEQRIAEQEIQLAAASKMAALGQMAAGIAHEINNPLGALLVSNDLLADLIEKESLDKEKVAKIIKRIESMGQRIANIVKSCKAFSRDGSEDPMETAAVKLIVDETLELCKGRFMAHGVELRIDKIPSDLLIECRPSQVSQVLLNLLNNAFDAISEHATKWISVKISTHEEFLEIVVSDCGKGIPKEAVEKIFDPFYTTKAPGKGTGLGLNICRGIIKDHGGDIYVDQEAMNTTFVIKLPFG